MRLIDADALIRDIDNSADLGGALGKVVECVKIYAKFMVQTAPTIEERKKGKWGTFPHHVYDDGTVLYGHACSECKRLVLCSCNKKSSYSFCPYCGADMRGSDISATWWTASMGVSEDGNDPNCGADMRGGDNEQT